MTKRSSLRAFKGLCGAIILAASSIATVASPITFLHSGTASGSLDGVAFGVTAFTITAIADTDNIVSPAAGVLAVEHDFASISIGGGPDLEFVTNTQTFFNDNVDVVGFQTLDGGILDLFDGPLGAAALDGWDLASTLGTVSGLGVLLQWSAVNTIVTDGLSNFSLHFGFQYTTSTFESEAGAVTPVPLPAALPLFLGGIGLMGLFGWRRRRVSEAA